MLTSVTAYSPATLLIFASGQHGPFLALGVARESTMPASKCRSAVNSKGTRQ